MHAYKYIYIYIHKHTHIYLCTCTHQQTRQPRTHVPRTQRADSKQVDELYDADAALPLLLRLLLLLLLVLASYGVCREEQEKLFSYVQKRQACGAALLFIYYTIINTFFYCCFALQTHTHTYMHIHTLKCATTVGKNEQHSATVDDGRDDNGHNDDEDVACVHTLFMRQAQRTE